jgi:heme exporter protein D
VRNLVIEGTAITLKILGDAGLHPLKRKKRVLAKVAGERCKELLIQTVKMKTVILHILHKIYQ